MEYANRHHSRLNALRNQRSNPLCSYLNITQTPKPQKPQTLKYHKHSKTANAQNAPEHRRSFKTRSLLNFTKLHRTSLSEHLHLHTQRKNQPSTLSLFALFYTPCSHHRNSNTIANNFILVYLTSFTST